MRKQVLSLGATFFVAWQIVPAQTITGFGSGDFTETFSDFTTTAQTATTWQVSGPNDLTSAYGSLTTPVNLGVLFSTLRLNITGVLAAANTGNFGVELFDVDGDSAQYNGSWNGFTAAQTSSQLLSYVSDNGFNGTVVSLGISTTKVDVNPATVTFTFDSLVAQPIPEPSTYMALAGFGILGYTLVRRRRSKTRATA